MSKKNNTKNAQQSATVSIPNDALPLPLKLALRNFEQETSPFRKVHRLIDAIEVFIKIHTVITVSSFFDREKIPVDLRTLLYSGLRTPSLGIWWAFSREFIKVQIEPGAEEYKKSFVGNLSKKGTIFKELESSDNPISFRNSYAHGATPPDERCTADINKYYPRLQKMIDSCTYFQAMSLLRADAECILYDDSNQIVQHKPGSTISRNRLYLQFGEDLIDLHPLLVYRANEDKYFFYNDLRKKELNLLNYDSSLHLRDVLLRHDFLQRYPIDEQPDTVTNAFKDMIESLTETFKGRRAELKTIIDFLCNYQSGFLFIWGGPGVGKSALLARAVQLFGWSEEVRRQAGYDEEIFSGKLHVIEYLIRRDMKSNNTEELLNNLLSRFSRIFNIPYRPGNTVKEQEKNLELMLDVVSTKLGENDRLLLIIDGLDEAVEVPELLAVLPKRSRQKILVIYSSRPNPAVEQKVYTPLSREDHKAMKLEGLSVEDTRAMLYEYVNKYRLRENYIEVLAKKSQGNPLFIKLICLGLERNEISLDEELEIPDKLSEIYVNTMRRLNEYPHANDYLRLLAAVKDFLDNETALGIMQQQFPGLNIDQLCGDINYQCAELLLEEKSGRKHSRYQLFHESLREYITENPDYAKEMRTWNRTIIKWASGWKNLEGAAKGYALKFLLVHMKDEYYFLRARDEAAAKNLLQEMISIIESSDFRRTLFLRTGNDYALRSALKSMKVILKSEDKDGENLGKILQYAIQMHTTRAELYDEQMESLLKQSRDKNFNQLLDYSRMGLQVRDKILLVLRGIWYSGSIPLANPEIKKQIQKWLSEINEPALEKLVEMSVSE